MYGLPAEIKYCKICVISNQRPRSTVEFSNSSSDQKSTIFFNADGICEACVFAIEKDSKIDWELREAELIKLLDRHRKAKGYDVIVPGSGGKDSAYTAHILKQKYGMNPLTVTWAPHLYTQIGWQNFINWSHQGGLDNILFTPNGKLHRILTREAFMNLLHPFQPFIVGQRIIGPKIAEKFDVSLIFYGENQAEYGNDISENQNPKMDRKFFMSESSLKFGGLTISDLVKKYQIAEKEFEPYLPLIYASSDLEVHYLGYYHKWDPQECFYYAVENTGFIPAPERTQGSYSKYSSLDDKIDPFHYFTTLIKFGLGRASYDAAQEIRTGKITRDEGVSLVKQFDQEFPEKYFKEFMEYISISEKDFWDAINKGRSPHIWKQFGENWELRNPVWKE